VVVSDASEAYEVKSYIPLQFRVCSGEVAFAGHGCTSGSHGDAFEATDRANVEGESDDKIGMFTSSVLAGSCALQIRAKQQVGRANNTTSPAPSFTATRNVFQLRSLQRWT